jgi:hypothetical protein
MYDIIGDIHGQAAELEMLLQKLGYTEKNEVYYHPSRTVIFVGDFIDRGARQRDVINIARSMVGAGHARAIMANHEFNALAYHTPDPEAPGQWMRERSPKNTRQHAAFLEDHEEHSAEKESTLNWFRTLPLWLELEGIRIVHACWHPDSMRTLAPWLNPDKSMKEGLIVQSSREGTPEYDAVEVLLKGLEKPLPDGVRFKDKDGNSRDQVRIKWWVPAAVSFADIALPENVVEKNPILAEIPAPKYSHDLPQDKPIFFGHYWFKGPPVPVTSAAACVDYSVAREGGELAAYRWDGESVLSASKFVCVDSQLSNAP